MQGVRGGFMRVIWDTPVGYPCVRTFSPHGHGLRELPAPEAQHEVNTSRPRFGTCA